MYKGQCMYSFSGRSHHIRHIIRFLMHVKHSHYLRFIHFFGKKRGNLANFAQRCHKTQIMRNLFFNSWIISSIYVVRWACHRTWSVRCFLRWSWRRRRRPRLSTSWSSSNSRSYDESAINFAPLLHAALVRRTWWWCSRWRRGRRA